MLNADFAYTGHLQLVQAVAYQRLGVLIAMLLVIELHPLPEIPVYRIGIGSLVLAIRRRLRGKQYMTSARANFGML